MICLDCNREFAIDTSLGAYSVSELNTKYKQHRLFHHPREEDVIDLYHDIEIKWRKIQNAYHAGGYVEASILLSELSTDALRFKKYIDMELGED